MPWKSVYEPQMCEAIIACAREGQGIAERCVEIGIHIATYYRWIDPKGEHYHPEFHEAHIAAEAVCLAWWEKQGRTYMVEGGKDSPRLNAQVYRLNMMNRFGWGENSRNHNVNEEIIVEIAKPKPSEGA